MSRFLSMRSHACVLLMQMLMVMMMAITFTPITSWAQEDEPVTVDQQLDNLRKQIKGIQDSLQSEQMPDDGALSQMKADALGASAEADRVAKSLEPQLESVKARLAELGKPLEAGTKEAPDVAQQRTQLERNSGNLDAQLKLARLLTVEADQASEQVTSMRRAQLQARLGERTTSIFTKPFRLQVQAELPQNLSRLRAVTNEIKEASVATPAPIWIGLIVGTMVLIGLRIWFGHLLLRFTSTRVPHGRLRRSMYALALTLLSVVTPLLIAELAKSAIRWDSVLSDTTTAFIGDVVSALCFGGLVAGLGYALLSPGRPSWRLIAMDDKLAHRMRHFPIVFASVMVIIWIAERLSVLVNAGLSTAVAVNYAIALLLTITIGLGLRRAQRKWRKIKLEDPDQDMAAPFWLRVVIGLLWAALAINLLSLLSGYVAFGSFMSKQLSWTIVLVAATYLLCVLVDDICMLLASAAPDPEAKVLPTPKARDQAAVLLSGVIRAIVVFLAIMLLLAPFGAGPEDLLHRIGQLDNGLTVGEFQIRPGSVFQAVLVLGVGFLSLRLIKYWLENRYLPTTNLDAGMQASASTLFGYVGGIIAFSMALSALGIGLERIAWIASALSVGIGFGLQAVVQNFVSGLILLAERPVKVGDWVSLGGVEGDIRRINVRATEIQMGDRSTVIVPNSEFITKTVRNVTHASPLGLIQIKLPLPLEVDVELVRDVMLQVFVDNPDVLDSPAPNVQLDSVDSTGNLMFNATGFASSPRLTYGIRSNLLFEMMKRLREHNVTMVRNNSIVIREQSMPDLLERRE